MSAFDGLPPLREVLERHKLVAKKSLGQNFLLDLNLTHKIAKAAGSLKGQNVIEVGPGPGGLTRGLMACGAAHVIAIERDSRCIGALEEIGLHYPGRLTIIEGDALTIDYADLCATYDCSKIIANLPYNIGTQLLTDWLSPAQWPPHYSSLTLLFQREVAQRIVAAPSSNHYGRLGVLAGWRTTAEIMFDISPQAFTPAPKVTSSLVHLQMRENPLEVAPAALENVTKHAFGQRRKMLRQSMKPLGGEALLVKAGIDPTRRAETLSVEEFVRLANMVESS